MVDPADPVGVLATTLIWVLQDSEIDPLELPDGLKTYSRQMAGEEAVSLTADRAKIMLSSAAEVEFYSGRMWFRGPGGAPRVTTSVVEVDGPGDVPIVGAMPKSTGVTIDGSISDQSRSDAASTVSMSAASSGSAAPSSNSPPLNQATASKPTRPPAAITRKSSAANSVNCSGVRRACWSIRVNIHAVDRERSVERRSQTADR